jgi:RNA polymerase sigma-70 factor (ECF subfamily)
MRAGEGRRVRAAPSQLGEVFAENERHLFGLCYRLTGSAADADDLVQETFRRAMETPPPDVGRPWRPWLVRVALNAGRDLLRKRKRRSYVGPWLPSPILTGDDVSPPSHEIPASADHQGTEGRYDLLESVSYAFLLALEALTPQQRAVLLLRDVFDYSVQETAEALGISLANAKTTHHRARRAMERYDRTRRAPTALHQAEARRALERFLASLAAQDTATVEALLADDVRALNDGAGEFFAARVPVIGRRKVATFLLNISRRDAAGARYEMVMANGLPAIWVVNVAPKSGEAPCYLFRFDIDEGGRIRELHTVLATGKLTALRGL